MDILKVVLWFLGGVLIVSAIPYTIGYWFTKGKLHATVQVINETGHDCDDEDCPLHGGTDG